MWDSSTGFLLLLYICSYYHQPATFAFSATYTNVSAHLDGVPETTESQQQYVIHTVARLQRDAKLCRYWQEFLAELRRVTSEKYGPEFIDDCLSLEVDAVKEKYGS